MKKMWMIAALSLLLCGCAAETFETLGAVEHEPAAEPAMATVLLTLPDTASAEVFSAEDGSLYDCGDYVLTLQTLPAGDVSRTIKELSGFEVDRVTVLESGLGETRRYEWVWTAAGEGGDVLCRAAVLDDGSYHYCLCLMARSTQVGALQAQWSEILRSFALEAC